MAKKQRVLAENETVFQIVIDKRLLHWVFREAERQRKGGRRGPTPSQIIGRAISHHANRLKKNRAAIAKATEAR